MKKCPKCENQYVDEYEFCLKDGSTLVFVSNQNSLPANQSRNSSNSKVTESLTNLFELVKNNGGLTAYEWLRTNKKIAAGIGFSFIVLFSAYLFLKPNPQSDGQKIGASYCRCSEIYNDAVIRANIEFSNYFAANKFPARQDARNKLNDIQSIANKENDECQNKSAELYDNLRNKYQNNPQSLQDFDSGYGLFNCELTNENELTAASNDVEEKILSIKDPIPDITRIKTDLIGHSTNWWNFDALSEFQNSEILTTNTTEERVEYKIKFHLKGSTSEHDAEYLVSYSKEEDDWYFDSVKTIYFTYTNTAKVNEWTRVQPYPKSNYAIVDNGHQFWIQDGQNGVRYKGGVNGDTYSLKSSEIFIMSRETQPINLVFKYTPIE
jgi:hypothetical protein